MFLYAAILSALCACVIGFYIGYLSRPKAASRWKLVNVELPPDFGRVIVNYPIAMFDPEFGIIVDQAEYHPNASEKWLSVPYGDPVMPYAWFDLPFPAWPGNGADTADMGARGRVDTYI